MADSSGVDSATDSGETGSTSSASDDGMQHTTAADTHSHSGRAGISRRAVVVIAVCAWIAVAVAMLVTSPPAQSEQPLVTVMLITHNRPQFLPRALAQIEKQGSLSTPLYHPPTKPSPPTLDASSCVVQTTAT